MEILPENRAIQQSKKNNFGFTVRNKALKNRNIVQAIDKYLLDNHKLTLPAHKSEYLKHSEGKILNSFSVDYETGEIITNCNCTKPELGELINYRYAIQQTKGYYAEFPTANHVKILTPLAFNYSKHRLCAVWNWRKSQIIRSKYFQYLQTAEDEAGRLLTSHYLPVHLVLTVPHEGGKWQGSEFYAKELIEKFTQMRKDDIWKKYIYCGEYGVEVKKSKKHGLHIHIHSFLMQHPEYSINKVRAELAALWQSLTRETYHFPVNRKTTKWVLDNEGNEFLQLSIPKPKTFKGDILKCVEALKDHKIFKIYAKETGPEIFSENTRAKIIKIPLLETDFEHFSKIQHQIEKIWRKILKETPIYSGLHYEGLYTYKNEPTTKKYKQSYRLENGKKLTDVFTIDAENVSFDDSEGNEIEFVPEREKDYIRPGDDLKKYVKGVMECIKYHFKPDSLEKNAAKEYDIELIMQILNNTKGKRLYSRFGKFYGVKELNFNNLEKEDLSAFEKLDTLSDETEVNTDTTVNGVEESLFHPVTYANVTRNDYKIAVGNPLYIRYNLTNPEKAKENFCISTDFLTYAPQSFSLKDTIKLDLKGFDLSVYNLDITEERAREQKLQKTQKYERSKYKITTKREKLLQMLNIQAPHETKESFTDELILLDQKRDYTNEKIPINNKLPELVENVPF